MAPELRVVVGRLVRRLRAEYRLPLAQATVLSRLDREGAQSVSELAAAERLRPQSMAQTVADMQAAGLIERKPDAHDRRRALVMLTDSGRQTLKRERERRDGWLAQTIESRLTPAERRALAAALSLLDRIAEA